MLAVDVVVETPVSDSYRARALEGMFDVPYEPLQTREWHFEIDLDFDWQVGLITGPSGAGKTLTAQEIFGPFPPTPPWGGASVIDDFPERESIEDITAACSAVGFNTMPAWLRP